MSERSSTTSASGVGDPMENWAPLEMSPEQRRAWAKDRIAELTPLEHEAIERLDAVLTGEQHKLRLEASVTGHRFGLTGVELFQHVIGAMNLSDEQKQSLAAARCALREIRQAIGPHLGLLLSDEQRQQMDASE